MLFNVINYSGEIIGEVEAGSIVEAWSEAGKRYENVLDVRMITKLREITRYKLSNFEITDKGKEYFRSFDYSLFSLVPNGPDVKRFRYLQCVDFQAKYANITWNELESALPELESKGYIEYVYYTPEALLEKISSPILKNNILIYYKIANQLPVTDDEVNYLFSDLFRRVKNLCRTIEKGEAESIGCSRIIEQCTNAISRSDKILAIDAIMATVHGMGLIASSLYVTRDKIKGKDIEYHQRILGKLAGG